MGNGLDCIDRLVDKYKKLWWETGCTNSLDRKYLPKEKQSKESKLDLCINRIFSSMDKMPNNKLQMLAWQDELKEILREEAKLNLEIQNKELESKIIDGFLDVTSLFITKVREFDPEFELIDIMQAMRNVWIMNLIQVISNKEVEFTPSIFAYSLLYPYTDNFLDDPNVSQDEKKEFNEHLKKRLQGLDITHHNAHEEKIYKLIEMIENQYDRDKYPEVFKSIISIHNGQCKSLCQQSHMASPYENDILAISAEKGGTSVLADAYLVCGHMDDELIDLIFGFGFVLQLIDDLQDTKEDITNDNMTIFSQTAMGFRLDGITNKLISFTYKALEFERYNVSPYILDVKKLILNNSILMIFEAINKNKNYFSKDYIRDMEIYSAISFGYFKRTKRKIQKQMKAISKKNWNMANVLTKT